MENTFEDAFFIATGWYENAGEGYDELINDILHTKDGEHFILENKEYPYDVLFSCLVLMFGDYGVNPQNGWIEDTQGAAEWLTKMRKNWKPLELTGEQSQRLKRYENDGIVYCIECMNYESDKCPMIRANIDRGDYDYCSFANKKMDG